MCERWRFLWAAQPSSWQKGAPFCWQMLEYPGGHLALLVASSHVTSYPGSQATSVLLLVGSLKPLSLNFFSCLKQALLVGVDLTHPVQECGGQMVMKVKWLQRMAGESSISLHWPPLPLPVLVTSSLSCSFGPCKMLPWEDRGEAVTATVRAPPVRLVSPPAARMSSLALLWKPSVMFPRVLSQTAFKQ